jgi:hypothetical protein
MNLQVPFLTGMNSVSEIRTMFAAEVKQSSSMDPLNNFQMLLSNFALLAAYIKEQDNAFC